MICDIYVRLSEDKTGEEAGVDRQLQECVAFIDSKGWQVGQVLADNDISATTGKVRPEFERLLVAKSKAIVVWHIDRLVRVSKDLERVIELGVNVHAVHSGHVDLSNPAGRAVARTVTAWATYEGEQKSLRQKSANAQRARAGASWWPRRPFGFELDGQLREAEALDMRLAYANVLAGVPLTRIAIDLNAAGHRTNRGNEWTPTSLRPVLLNARNAGIRVYNGEEIGAAAWQSIVPEDAYRSAVRLLTDPSRSAGGGGPRQNLLTGVATCGVCHSGVKVAWRGKKGSTGAYKAYVCRGSSCVSHRQEWVDKFVGSFVVRRMSRPDARQLLTADDGVGLEGARVEAVRLREKLDEIADDRAEDRISRKQMLDMTEKTRAKLAAVEAVMSQAQGDSALLPLLNAKDPARAWAKDMTLDQKRRAVEALAVRVEFVQRGRGRSDMRPSDVHIEERRPPRAVA